MQRQVIRGHAAGAGLIFHVFAQDSASTTGAGKASIAFSSWACRYIRNGEAISGAITPEDITTIGTYAAPSANTNIRIKAVDNTNMIGVYEVQIHADWVNATNTCHSLTLYLTATGVAVLPIQIPLVGFNPQDGVRLGLTALPNAGAEAAGGLYTRGTGAGQIEQDANGRINVRLADAAHGGSAATLTLKNVTVVATDANTSGIIVTGLGSGDGLRTTGGATGHGVRAWGGATSGHGIEAAGIGTGSSTGVAASGVHGISGVSSGPNGQGMLLSGSGSGDGLNCLAGATGQDIDADITGNITGNLSGSVGSVTGAVGSVGGQTLANLDATVSSRATPAQVNTEVLDVLNVDTFAEPGQAAPPATSSLVAKISYLYKFLRNRITQTSTTLSVYADDATTVDQKATVSDNGTTYDRGEIVGGP
jgi:hypothetical protein